MMENLRDSFDLRYAAAAAVLLLVMATGFVAQSLNQSTSGLQQQATSADMALARDAGYTESGAGSSGSASSPMFAISYNIDVKTANVRDAMDATSERAEIFGGRVESESFDRRNGESGHLDVLVPKSNASSFVSEMESGYDLESINRNKRDVSDRYTETTLELKNKKQELNRLEELINQTDEVSSLIDIQERMSELRSRIQYLEQRQADIEEDVEYVDISISFETPGTLNTGFELRESLADAYRGIFNSLNLLIVGTGYLLPFALVAAVLYGLKRIYTKRFS